MSDGCARGLEDCDGVKAAIFGPEDTTWEGGTLKLLRKNKPIVACLSVVGDAVC